MKLIHISDLHFGKSIHGISLIEQGDQPHWVEEFLGLVDREQPDAIVIAGDVYDRSAPSDEATKLLSQFYTKIAERGVPLFVVSGNHDSGTKLSFAGPLLERAHVYTAGTIDGGLRHVELTDEYGPVHFWLMPFVFPALVRRTYPDAAVSSYDDAVRKVIAESDIDFSQRNVLIAHQNVMANGEAAIRGGSESMVGGLDAVDYTAFDGFTYVALGHIHAAQSVGRREVRYAGSPLCYHFSELKASKKGPVVVTLGAPGAEAEIRTELLEVKHPMREVKGTLEEILAAEKDSEKRGEYLRVVLTDDPVPVQARDTLQALFEGKGSLLLDFAREVPGRNYDELTGGPAEQEKTVEELFGEFFEARSGRALNPEEGALIALIAGQILRADPGEQAVPDEDISEILALAEKWEDAR